MLQIYKLLLKKTFYLKIAKLPQNGRAKNEFFWKKVLENNFAIDYKDGQRLFTSDSFRKMNNQLLSYSPLNMVFLFILKRVIILYYRFWEQYGLKLKFHKVSNRTFPEYYKPLQRFTTFYKRIFKLICLQNG